MDAFKTGFFWIVTSWEILIFFWFWFNGKTCQNVSFSYDTTSVFHSIPIIAFEFWNPKKQRKTGGRNKMCQNHLLFPSPPSDTWISFGKLSIFQCCYWNWIIGVLLFPCYCRHIPSWALWGWTFFWESSVPTPERGMQPPVPTEEEVSHVFLHVYLWICLISAACEGFGSFCWLSVWKEWKLLFSAGSGASCWPGGLSYGVSGSSVQWELLTTARELWRQQEAAGPKMNNPTPQQQLLC